LPGWIAQWKKCGENKEPIGRPRQVQVIHPHFFFFLLPQIKIKIALKKLLAGEAFLYN
jgi:hypothetical protein